MKKPKPKFPYGLSIRRTASLTRDEVRAALTRFMLNGMASASFYSKNQAEYVCTRFERHDDGHVEAVFVLRGNP